METDVFSIISLYIQGEVINRFRQKQHFFFVIYLLLLFYVILLYLVIPKGQTKR